MNDFIVKLDIKDTITSNECCNSLQKTVTITATSQTIMLQNDYILNVIRATPTYCTVLIQNGIEVIIRNIYTNYTTCISLPCTSNCSQQVICLSCNVSEDDDC
jgi:hypothetical protein